MLFLKLSLPTQRAYRPIKGKKGEIIVPCKFDATPVTLCVLSETTKETKIKEKISKIEHKSYHHGHHPSKKRTE